MYVQSVGLKKVCIRRARAKESENQEADIRRGDAGARAYLVRKLRAEWCWVSGDRGLDSALGESRSQRVDSAPGESRSQLDRWRNFPVAGALSSAARALPNHGLGKRQTGHGHQTTGTRPGMTQTETKWRIVNKPKRLQIDYTTSYTIYITSLHDQTYFNKEILHRGDVVIKPRVKHVLSFCNRK